MISRPLQIDVEPLNERRWARIEENLFIEFEACSPNLRPSSVVQRHASRSWLWLAAAAVVVGVLGVFAGRSYLEPASGASLDTSRITTGAQASLLNLPGLRVDVEPESTVVIGGESETGRLIVLDRGSIICDVARRATEAPLMIQAGGTQVRVVGTRFRVERLGETARVEVEHGVVEVTARAQTTRVAAGQVWPAPPKAQETSSKAAEPTLEAETNREESPAPSLGAPAKPATRTSPVDRAPAPKLKDTRQDRFEDAARLERSNPGKALQLYRSIETGSDSWAQNALYAHGQLEAARGNKAEAKRLLKQYLERFPKGANSADARAVLKRLE